MGTATDVVIPVHAKGLRPGASSRSRLGIRSEPENLRGKEKMTRTLISRKDDQNPDFQNDHASALHNARTHDPKTACLDSCPDR
jgi:hypothetical protein